MGGQCVPNDEDATEPDPWSGDLEVSSVCQVDFGIEDEDDYSGVQDIWDLSVLPTCNQLLTAMTRVFTPTFVSVGDCPFTWDGVELEYGGDDYALANTDIACRVLEDYRADVQNVLGYIYLLLSMVVFVRLS